MLHILWGVLKAIGIFLAVILCLFLVMILIVLLGPICYRASGRYGEDRKLSVGVSWLGFVLKYKAEYDEKQGFLWWLRLFGILIDSNDDNFIQKKEAKRRKKVVIQEAETAEPEQFFLEETYEESDDILEDFLEPAEHSVTAETVKEEYAGNREKNISGQQTQQPTGKYKKKLFDVFREKVNFVKKSIANLIGKIKSIPSKIKNMIASGKAKMEELKAKTNRFLEWKEFFLGEKNRAGFLHVLHNLKKMICHILPTKLLGKVEFGVEDPYVMGQILTVLGIFYPVYQDKFTVLPEFDNPGFKGEASFRGHIIPGYLLLRMLVALCNWDVIRIIKEARKLIGGKEA